jgi:hypothetical protein
VSNDQRGPFTIPSGKMLLRALAYIWPASRPAAVGLLTDDGSGNLSHTQFATPTIGLGSSASAGTVDRPIRSDANIAAFDTFTASTQAFGDGATTGAVNKASRRDHVHGMPVDPVPAHNVNANVHGFGSSTTLVGNKNNEAATIQYGISSVTYGAGSAFTPSFSHDSGFITYAIAFTTVRAILIGGGDHANAYVGAAFANDGSTHFKVRVYDNVSGSYGGSVHWMAIGL